MYILHISYKSEKLTAGEACYLKSMGAKFLQDIYLYQFVFIEERFFQLIDIGNFIKIFLLYDFQ